MKKAYAIFIIVVLMFAVAGNVLGEEMAKKGSVSGKMYASGTSKMLAMGQERVQMNYECSGITIDDSGKGLIHNAAFYAVGSSHAIKGNFEDSGFTVFTPPDGDKIYGTYKCSGTFGKPVEGTWTYVGGTGKYEGIEGSGEFTRYPLQNAAEAVWTSLTVTKGNYKVP